ncbi:MAG: hypothetical protein ACRBN8_22555 [Nannocystales bacterium]
MSNTRSRRLTDAERAEEFRLQLDEAKQENVRLHDELFEARRMREAAEKHAKWQDEQNARLREALEGVCGTTGAWAQRVGDGERDWRVRFSFEGETHFASQAEAQEAGAAYERIVADAVHGDELARLRAVTGSAMAWQRQGARSKWSTPESLALWDAVDALTREEGEGS